MMAVSRSVIIICNYYHGNFLRNPFATSKISKNVKRRTIFFTIYVITITVQKNAQSILFRVYIISLTNLTIHKPTMRNRRDTNVLCTFDGFIANSYFFLYFSMKNMRRHNKFVVPICCTLFYVFQYFLLRTNKLTLIIIC